MSPVGGLEQGMQQQGSRGGGGPGDELDYFKLANGEEAVVRFLEDGQNIHWCYTHPTPPPPGWKYGEDTPCLDQGGTAPETCPGCQMKDPQDPNRSLERAFTGFINLIWRNGPVYAKKDNGYPDRKNIISRKDGIFTWTSGRRLFTALAEKDATYKGLTTRDFRAKRVGIERDTRYTIEPVLDEDGSSKPTPLGDADKKLITEKPDLNPHVTPLSKEQFMQVMRPGSVPQAESSTDSGESGEPNPFDDASASAFAGTK